MGGTQCCEALTNDLIQVTGTYEQELETFFKRHPKIKEFVESNPEFLPKHSFPKESLRRFFQGLYIGQLNSNNLPHTSASQKGYFLYNEGYLYEGEMKNGKRSGLGRIVNEEGEYYHGDWSDNNPNGRGKYYSNLSNRQYEGEWIDGQQSGQGVEQYFEDGSKYEGQFLKGFKHGKGRFTYAETNTSKKDSQLPVSESLSFEGEFYENQIQGYGVIIGKFHKYEGEWKEGKMSGNGKSTWFDNLGTPIAVYVGQYLNGLKHGFGEYRWGDKHVYKGNWEEGQMVNEGVMLNFQ